ncbi:MAG TPA: DMT family transporter [Candidatus Acidoferrales bacterium]|nr:DMT family transporter [Candidatus Acidoferrales bacterium]
MAIVLALAAAMTYGAADFLGGAASRRASTATVVIVSQLAGLVVLLAALPFFGGRLSRADLILGVACGLCGAFAITTLYAALATGRMGIVSPITAVVAAALPVLVGLGLGERPTLAAQAGVALALVAVVLVSTNDRTGRFSLGEPGIKLALVSGLGMGALFVLLSRSTHDSGLWFLVPMRVTSLLVMFAWSLVRAQLRRPQREVLATMLFAGIVDMAANVIYVLATRAGMLIIVAVITALYPAATVLLARAVLKERLTRLQWGGVAGAAAAVVLIASRS